MKLKFPGTVFGNSCIDKVLTDLLDKLRARVAIAEFSAHFPSHLGGGFKSEPDFLGRGDGDVLLFFSDRIYLHLMHIHKPSDDGNDPCDNQAAQKTATLALI